MSDARPTTDIPVQTGFVRVLSVYAIAGCAIFVATILIADVVVPHHDWIADTISDLGAGKYEYIVDTGIYAFSASLLAVAMAASHLHPGGWRWSLGVSALALLALIVFLVGARNEYGDRDQDGAVIHIYLVYALGVLMAVIPLLMAGDVETGHRQVLRGLGALWILAAPVFFFLPDSVDGIYERGLGLISFAVVATLAHLFIQRVRQAEDGD